MIIKNEFFIPENRIEYLPEEMYQSINQIIEDIDAFARTTYKSIYLIDYYKQNLPYVSDNPLFLCGKSPEEVQKMGYHFFLDRTTREDLEMLLEVNRAGFEFASRLPDDEKMLYTIGYDFHIIHQVTGRKTLIYQQITPLRLTDEGKVWLALCTASVSSRANSGNVEIFTKKLGRYYTYNLKSGRWQEKEPTKLKPIEKDIIYLSAKGYTTQDIAEELFKSVDTIKFHRKNLFNILGVSNISEAINCAMNLKLI
ncbi:MAG: helix-turn-helix transcriptional regulator [Porphyromonadaceae bacterium]|jgi:DNA-binding CsgD family transcriptional regulator|nr:helix-turn-helix transcriptional regulator [Porphyromonadaceae bacterium]